MRSKILPKTGDTRRKKGFLWLPKTLYLPETSYSPNPEDAGRQTRWFEQAEWIQRYHPIEGWVDDYWVS